MNDLKAIQVKVPRRHLPHASLVQGNLKHKFDKMNRMEEELEQTSVDLREAQR